MDQSRVFTDEHYLKVGRHILETYNKWTEKPIGTYIQIPIKIPNQRSDQPDWAMDVQCTMPWFIERYFENGEPKSRHLSLAEYLQQDSL